MQISGQYLEKKVINLLEPWTLLSSKNPQKKRIKEIFASQSLIRIRSQAHFEHQYLWLMWPSGVKAKQNKGKRICRDIKTKDG